MDFRQGMPFTPAVKWLLIINVAVWFGLQVVLEGFILRSDALSAALSLVPERVLFGGAVWQLFTYMFLHTSQVTHILFNMLMLWFFGAELEQRWGTKFFVAYYLVCGVGAAVIYVVGTALAAGLFGVGAMSLLIPVQGASGAVFGLLLAYGLLFGDRTIYFFMVFPMKARYFVMIMGFVELASLMTSRERGGEVAYLAHLGGLISGFVFLKGWGWWQRYRWNRKIQQKHKGRNLRLVVDNDKNKNDKDGPRYWN
ncbi:MAG: rhomboid family intramembrane serine protease [Bdellovibrionaceae bacterium]|nr:rhomboid family intramembrane serine protease [Pseudobdellovibrionaceae bacterium]MBX3033105.1 rhomboid family intramembrane serine protease [Pseudobdellovibrionaceae bacterium]